MRTRSSLAHTLLGGHALGEVAGDLGEGDELAVVVLDGGDDHARPEERAVLAHPPALVLEAADALGLLQLVLGPAAIDVGLAVEDRKMLADDLGGQVALDALRPRVPG